MSVIGRGNFGKVYLVYLPQTKQYYARKSIRKDIVLDNDSSDRETLQYLEEISRGGARVARVRGGFNFARITNAYAILAEGV